MRNTELDSPVVSASLLRRVVGDRGTRWTKAQLARGADRSILAIVVSTRSSKEDVVPNKRTTHRSVSGKKLYAVRDAKGRFVDIQTHERASRQDQARSSKAERQAKKR